MSDDLKEIQSPPTTPDYMLKLVLDRYLTYVAFKVSKDHPELVKTFNEYLEGKSFEHMPKWEQFREDLIHKMGEIKKG